MEDSYQIIRKTFKSIMRLYSCQCIQYRILTFFNEGVGVPPTKCNWGLGGFPPIQHVYRKKYLNVIGVGGFPPNTTCLSKKLFKCDWGLGVPPPPLNTTLN